MSDARILLAALAIDAVFGEPSWLYTRAPHPVVLIGGLIGRLDRLLNQEVLGETLRRTLGAVALGLLLIATVLPTAIVSGVLSWLPGGWLVEALLASTLIAQRSLYDHVAAVAAALETGGLSAGRRAVSMIVGRNPESLDEAGASRAAIESCAENFSDGVVAPVFWFIVLGLPGIVAYKAINTADSMIGHRTPRHEAFGWAAARLDDLVNLIPARLAGGLIVLASFVLPGADRMERARTAWRIMLRDAGRHRSPNAASPRPPAPPPPPPLAQCWLAGSRHGRRARSGAGRSAALRPEAGARCLDGGGGSAGRHRSRHPPGTSGADRRLRDPGRHRPAAHAGLTAPASSSIRSRSRWVSRCAASASSVDSISAS
jgi:adenosylcobinamide-phosphate synthase